MIALTRLPDWDRRLVRLVSSITDAPGVWGETDCLLTALSCVEAITGFDPAADVRGTYKTQVGAAKALRKRGLNDVEEALASLFLPVGRLMAQRGDVGVVEQDGVLCAGFVCDRGFLCRTETGRIFLPQTAMKTAFRVG